LEGTTPRFTETAVVAGAATILVNIAGGIHRLLTTAPVASGAPPEALWIAVVGVLTGAAIVALALRGDRRWALGYGGAVAATLWLAGLDAALAQMGVGVPDPERSWPFTLVADPDLLGGASTGPLAGPLLLLLALALTVRVVRPDPSPISIIGALLVVGALTAALSVLYPEPLVRASGWRPLPVTVVLGVLSAGIGVVALAGPSGWPVRRWMGSSVRATLTRWFLPLTVLVVVGSNFATLRLFSDRSPAIASLLSTLISVAAAIFVIYTLARIIGGRLDQAEVETRRLTRLYAVVSETNAMLNRVRDPRDLFEEACRITVTAGGFDTAWVGKVDPETHWIEQVAISGRPEWWPEELRVSAADIPEGQGPMGTAIRERRPQVFHELQDDPRFTRWLHLTPGNRFRTVAAFPIATEGVVDHAIAIYSNEHDWFSAEQMALLEGLATNISYALGVLEHERRRAESDALLEQSEAQFRALIESGSDLVTIVDAAGRITYQSPSARTMLGYLPTERTGGNMRDLVHPEDLPAVEALSHRTITTDERALPLICRLRHKNGSWRLVEVEAWNMASIPGVRGFVLHARDVTDRESLEAQLRQAQKMEAVGQLAGGIAHDFNNVLSVILANAGLLGTRATDEDSRGELRDLQGAAERGKAMVRQLMGISRIEALSIRPTEIAPLLERIAGVLRRVLPANVTVRASADPDLPAGLVDGGAVEQMLLNLATNARDAMPGGGTFDLHASRTGDEGDGGHVIITATDSGMGMAPETLAKVLEPFFTTKPSGIGTGLGLPMVHDLMTQHGGSIGVTSTLGKGATVTLTFLASRRPAARVSAPVRGAAPARRGTETILVVDDEEMLRRAAQRILVANGYTVLVAEDGIEALALLRSKKVDLVFTDMMMPKLGGSDLYHQAIRELGPIRFLVASGHTQSDAAGSEPLPETLPFLGKPWTMDELLGAVRDALDGL
jgi:two-component system cell cycle sensor histidine kinase/response regulator CckA